MARVLVTGFEPFDKSSRNPSQAIVESLQHTVIEGVQLHCAVLPVEFERAGRQLLDLIDEVRPDIVLALGQAEGRAHITPERVAINLDDARIPDNSGELRTDQPIDPSAPTAHFSTLPVRSIVEGLQGEDIPAALSLSAGAFICNHVFFVMQHKLRESDVRSGFMHVPLMHEQADEFPEQPTMALTDMVRAVELAIRVSVAAISS